MGTEMLNWGRITRLYRKPRRGRIAGEPALGVITLMVGHLTGQDLEFGYTEARLPQWVKRGMSIRIIGELVDGEKGVLIGKMVPDISPKALRNLYDHKITANKEKWDSLFSRANAIDEKAVIELLENSSDPAEQDMAKSILDLIFKTDLGNLMRLFEEAGQGEAFQFSTVAEIYAFFEARARRNNMTVTNLVRKYPWIISQVDLDVCTPENAEALALTLGKSGPQADYMAATARMTALVWADARRGNCYARRGTIWRCLRNFFQEKTDQEVNELFSAMMKDLETGALAPLAKLYQNNEYLAEMKDDPLFARLPKKEVGQHCRGIYLPKVFHAEKLAAKTAAERAINPEKKMQVIAKRLVSGRWKPADKSLLGSYGWLDDDQKKAVVSIFENPISFIIGSAGSGKTHVLRTAVKIAADAGKYPVVCAPSAIAAFRAGQDLEHPFGTIHRFANIDYDSHDLVLDGHGKSDGGNSDFTSADLILVDETSMVDIMVLSHLLYIAKEGAHIAFFGDAAQLPSIEPGGFMQQIIRLRPSRIAVTELTKNYRNDSAIYRAANSIRVGEWPEEDIEVLETPLIKPGASLYEGPVIKTVASLAEGLVSQGVPWSDVLVMAPTRDSHKESNNKNTPGTNALNQVLSEVLNPKGREIPGTGFKVGDPIVSRENDYVHRRRRFRPTRHPERNVDIYNGLRGVISDYSGDTVLVSFNFGNATREVPYYPEELLFYVEQAFALTVHKAQGGQAKHVVFVGTGNMNRSMLYTAFTRAEESVLLLGPRSYWNGSVAREAPLPRSKFVYRYERALKSIGMPKRVSGTTVLT